MNIINNINEEYPIDIGLADLLGNSTLQEFVHHALSLFTENSEYVETIIGPQATKKPMSAQGYMVPQWDIYPASNEQIAVLLAESGYSPHTGYNLPQFVPLQEINKHWNMLSQNWSKGMRYCVLNLCKMQNLHKMQQLNMA